MLSNLAQLTHVIEGKVFNFSCANDAPLAFIKEALFQMQKYVGQIEDAAIAQKKAAEEEKAAQVAVEPAPVSEAPKEPGI